MQRPTVIVLGTRNVKKRRELEMILQPHHIGVRTLGDYSLAIEVVEDGQSFAENAQKKASQQARAIQAWVLGEDSGLVVDALGGAPGIYSARFSGPAATDASNNALLLERLAGLPPAQRTAHYTCHASLADPLGNIRLESTGICRGWIRDIPAGGGGFGYDPLFEVAEYHRTFGELGGELKNVISHRGRAMRGLLRDLLLWSP